MFSCFFKKAEPNCLSESFDQNCSLDFYKPRSTATQKLAKIIKENSTLNYKSDAVSLSRLSLEELESEMDKITTIFNAINAWFVDREGQSERVNKIKHFRDRDVRSYASKVLKAYQEKGGEFKDRWKADEKVTKGESETVFMRRFSYRNCFSFILGLPFVSQIFDAMPDMLSLLN